MKKRVIGLLSFILSFGLISCTCSKISDPADTVKQFIETSAGAKDLGDKQHLVELCGGEMRKAVDSLSDEVFTKVYLSGAIKLEEFKILEKETDGDHARVSYVVTIDNRMGSVPAKEVNEREVDLTHRNGKWLIEGIRLKGSDKLSFTEGMIF